MVDHEPALAAIHAAFADPDPVLIRNVDQPDEPVYVVWSDEPADAFQGQGATARRISCEIRQAHLLARPTKATRIIRRGVTWKPIDITDRDDVTAWVLVLEKA